MNVARDAMEELHRRAQTGDHTALAELFHLHHERLGHMVRLRMDRRLQGRIDPSDVLQETYLDCSRRLGEYATNPRMSFFVWLRFLTGQRLVDLHRQHLGAEKRDARRELSPNQRQWPSPRASSGSLAAQLLGRLTTASRAAIRAETQIRVQEALNSMDPLDREVLTLRHFEMLTNEETAEVLGLKKTAASNRYIRALKRLKEIVASIPGLSGSGC